MHRRGGVCGRAPLCRARMRRAYLPCQLAGNTPRGVRGARSPPARPNGKDTICDRAPDGREPPPEPWKRAGRKRPDLKDLALPSSGPSQDL